MTADDVRLRLRDLLHTRGVSQTELTRRLCKHTGEDWLIDHVSKLLRGEIRLRVEDVLLMCEVSSVSLVELFREPGREFVADLTPTELRLIHALRDHPKIMLPLCDVVATLAPVRKPSRAIVRDRMRRAKREE
jgi:transcriptional regulator with XRE-family HTH domain